MLFGQLLNIHRKFKRLAKALIRLRVCAGWSEALLVAHTTLLEISCTGSNTQKSLKIHEWVSTWELALIAYDQKAHLSTHTDVSYRAKDLNIGKILYWHTYFMYASSECSGESAHVRRLAWAFVAQQRYKYQNLKCWLKILKFISMTDE